MAYNTKPIVTDKDGNPISQYYNSTADKYEPVEGSSGANKVIVYKSDGTESNISLLPILDKLSQLTGTVIDEEIRKSNELQRIALYDLIFQMLQDGELKGEQGIQGIQGKVGKGLEFHWRGTELGVRVEGDTDYIYVDLKGDSGSIYNLNADDIEDALGYTPANESDVISKTPIHLSPGISFNQIIEPGIYYGEMLLDSPSDDFQDWIIEVTKGKEFNVIQKAMNTGTSNTSFYVRSSRKMLTDDGSVHSWGPWEEFATKSDITNVENDLATHEAEPMPHQIMNHQTGKKHRYGYQVSPDGIPQVISEEVI